MFIITIRKGAPLEESRQEENQEEIVFQHTRFYQAHDLAPSGPIYVPLPPTEDFGL
jgi:hypothetical protein